MEITSSYQVEILSNTDMKNTVQIYRMALAFVVDVCNKEWTDISSIEAQVQKKSFVEKLIHPTNNNPNPKYPFDIKGSEFYKFPSYLKRAVIAEAIGAVSSYRSNYKNWEDNGKNGNAPALQVDRHAMPVFYNKNMYKEDAPKNAKYPKSMNPGDGNIRWLKLYQNNDWVWIPVRLRKTDINYINKYWGACEDKSAPTLEKIHNKYYLRFSFTETVILSDTPIAEQIICAVDLGINTDAVCSIMKADGTILARKFIDFTSDKDRMIHAMNRTRRKQSKYGPKSVRGLWAYVKRLNEDRAKKISAAIVEFASQHSVDAIVIEHLDFNKSIPYAYEEYDGNWMMCDEAEEMEAYKKDIKKNEKLLPVSMPINSYMWTGDKFSTWYSGVYEIAIEDDMTKEYAKELAKKFAR